MINKHSGVMKVTCSVIFGKLQILLTKPHSGVE